MMRPLLQICNLLLVIFTLIACFGANDVSARPKPGRGPAALRSRSSSRMRCEQPGFKNGMARLGNRKILRFKCDSGFTRIGAGTITCTGSKWDTPMPVCARKGCSKPEAPSHGFLSVERLGLELRLFCQGDYLVVGNSKAYCDGEMWSPELGHCRESSKMPQLWCDFETEDLCGWTQDDSDDFQWKQHGAYQSHIIHTGPRWDNTYKEFGKGNYMLLESTDINVEDGARLVSPLYNGNESTNACFAINYFMYGAAVGMLRVLVKPLSIEMDTVLVDSRYLVYNVSGNQRNIWHNVTVNIDQYDEPFQIVIEGTPGIGHLADIAIDDVALFQGSRCAYEEEKGAKAQGREETTESKTDEDRDIIFDYQSCKMRCNETGPANNSDQFLTSGGIIKSCNCHDGCDETSTCCPDYKNLCVVFTDEVSGDGDVDTSVSDSAAVTDNVATRIIMTTTMPTVTLSRSTKILQTSTTTSTSRKITVTSPKTTTTTTTTRRPTTTSPTSTKKLPLTVVTTRKTTTTTTTATPKKTELSEGWTTLSGTTTKSNVKVTKIITTEAPPVLDPNDRYRYDVIDDEARSGSNESNDVRQGHLDTDPVSVHSVDKSASDTSSGNVALKVFFAAVPAVFVLLVGTVFLVRHLRLKYGPENYKANAERANHKGRTPSCEYSDVMYLAREEEIDFTMQTESKSVCK